MSYDGAIRALDEAERKCQEAHDALWKEWSEAMQDPVKTGGLDRVRAAKEVVGMVLDAVLELQMNEKKRRGRGGGE